MIRIARDDGLVEVATCLTHFEGVGRVGASRTLSAKRPRSGAGLPGMEGKIDMTARRQVTNKLRHAYAKASKRDKALILREVMVTTGMGRSTARRMLTGPELPAPKEQVDRRRLKPRTYSDDARALLEHVWALMGMPCGKYLLVMLDTWLPLLPTAGDLDAPFATAGAQAELAAMSAATIDRYLAPARGRLAIKGISTTKPAPLLRNSITIRRCTDEAPDAPGVVEADTVAHCGPTLIGEFARTLTMTDIHTGWTENASIRNNARKWITDAIEALKGRFPFPMTLFASDNGSEFINHQVATWLQQQDIDQTRSRPYKKNDPGHRGVQEQPRRAQARLLLALRHARGTRRAERAVVAGLAAVELLHTDQEAHRVHHR